jgi:hypothetical protein
MIQPRAPTIEILPVDDAIPGRLSQTKMMADLYPMHKELKEMDHTEKILK